MSKHGGYPGGMMPGNMNNLMKQAQRMQRQMEEKTRSLRKRNLRASSGGGAVTVKSIRQKQILSVNISKDAVDPDDVEMFGT